MNNTHHKLHTHFVLVICSNFHALLDIRRHNKGSHGIHKIGKTVRMSYDIFKRSYTLRHWIEANKLCGRAHRLYDAAPLIMCYTQHALHTCINTEINHIRHIIKNQCIQKRIKVIYMFIQRRIYL